MKSLLPKVLHGISGLTLIERVLRTAAALQPKSITIVVGHGADEVKRSLAKRTGLQFVTQEQQLGTGHALLQARAHLEGKKGTVVLLSGDAPLLTVDSLKALLETHSEAEAAATVITANLQRPFGYGRIVRTNGKISKIVEERDTTAAQKAITEINSGIYAFDLAPLFAALDTVGTANKQGEYYLPDLVAIYRKQKRAVATWTVQRADEIRGINSRTELAEVSTMVRQQKNEELMAAGVTLIDPATTYIDADVVVGADTVIYPCVFLEGSTKIGSACEIHSGARIVNSTIGDRVCVRNHTVVTDSTVEAGAFVGPVRAHPARIRGRRGCPHRQLRRAQEDRDGQGRESESPRLSWRCDDRRKNQCRRRHHHLQLRRREEAPDRDWQQRVRRQQQHARRSRYLG